MTNSPNLLSIHASPRSPVPKVSIGQRIARNVAHYRQHQGLTQQQLADAAQLSRATVNLIESGQGDPRASTIELLAKAMELDPADLTQELPPTR